MRKMVVRETVDAEIKIAINMELYSGAKMADGKYRKTYVAGSVDRENTVVPSSCSLSHLTFPFSSLPFHNIPSSVLSSVLDVTYSSFLNPTQSLLVRCTAMLL
jgi:hypothetical protein